MLWKGFAGYEKGGLSRGWEDRFFRGLGYPVSNQN